MTKENWLEIAEAFAIPPTQRTYEQDEMARNGVCWGVRCVLGCGWHVDHPIVNMVLEDARLGCSDEYFGGYGTRYMDNLRGLYCCLMAAMED